MNHNSENTERSSAVRKSSSGIIPKAKVSFNQSDPVLVGNFEFSSQANVQVSYAGNEIDYIDVTCDCGKVTRIHCDYDESRKAG